MILAEAAIGLIIFLLLSEVATLHPDLSRNSLLNAILWFRGGVKTGVPWVDLVVVVELVVLVVVFLLFFFYTLKSTAA